MYSAYNSTNLTSCLGQMEILYSISQPNSVFFLVWCHKYIFHEKQYSTKLSHSVIKNYNLKYLNIEPTHLRNQFSSVLRTS